MSTVVGTREQWLRCKLDRGMFSDEIVVTYPAQGAIIRSVFVPIDSVNGTAGCEGSVRVQVINRSGKFYAILPSSDSQLVAVLGKDLSDTP